MSSLLNFCSFTSTCTFTIQAIRHLQRPARVSQISSIYNLRTADALSDSSVPLQSKSPARFRRINKYSRVLWMRLCARDIFQPKNRSRKAAHAKSRYGSGPANHAEDSGHGRAKAAREDASLKSCTQWGRFYSRQRCTKSHTVVKGGFFQQACCIVNCVLSFLPPTTRAPRRNLRLRVNDRRCLDRSPTSLCSRPRRRDRRSGIHLQTHHARQDKTQHHQRLPRNQKRVPRCRVTRIHDFSSASPPSRSRLRLHSP